MDIPPRARWQLAAFGNPADLRDDLRRLCDFGHWAIGGAAVIGVPSSGAAFATYAGRALAFDPREHTLAKVRANFILTFVPLRRTAVGQWHAALFRDSISTKLSGMSVLLPTSKRASKYVRIRR